MLEDSFVSGFPVSLRSFKSSLCFFPRLLSTALIVPLLDFYISCISVNFRSRVAMKVYYFLMSAPIVDFESGCAGDYSLKFQVTG